MLSARHLGHDVLTSAEGDHFARDCPALSHHSRLDLSTVNQRRPGRARAVADNQLCHEGWVFLILPKFTSLCNGHLSEFFLLGTRKGIFSTHCQERVWWIQEENDDPPLHVYFDTRGARDAASRYFGARCLNCARNKRRGVFIINTDPPPPLSLFRCRVLVLLSKLPFQSSK